MDNNRLQQLLTRYFENTITKVECEEMLTYLDEGDLLTISSAIERALEGNCSNNVLPVDFDKKEDVFNRLITGIHQRQAMTNEPLPYHKFSFVPWLKIAALLVAVTLVGILLYNNRPSGFSMPPIVSENRDDISLPEH